MFISKISYANPHYSTFIVEVLYLLNDGLEVGLHVGPDLLGLGALEVGQDALGAVVVQHRGSVGLDR